MGIVPSILFILFEVLILLIGVYVNIYLIILIPVAFIALVVLLKFPGFSLLLMLMSGIIKGFAIVYIPIFEYVDLTLLLMSTTIIGVTIKYIMDYRSIFIPDWSKSILQHYLIICGLIMFAGLYTLSPVFGQTKTVSFLLFNTTLFIVPIIYVNSTSVSKYLMYAYMIIMSLVVVGMIYKVIYHYLTGGILAYILRVTVLGANPIPISRNLAIFAAMIFILVTNAGKTYRSLYFSGFLLVILALISTGSRGALLSLLLGLLIFVFLFRSDISKTVLKFMPAILLFIILLLFVLPGSVTGRYFQLMEGEIIVTATGVERVSTIGTRFMFWSMSLEAFLSTLKNFLVGLGFGGFSSLFIWRDFKWYPHNIIFEIMVELGVIGLMVFSMFALSIRKAYKDFSRHTAMSSITEMWMIALIVSFLSAMFSGDLVNNRGIFFFLAITMSSYHLDKNQ